MCLPVKQYWVILLLKRDALKQWAILKRLVNDSKNK
jgi:hypothetical protein